MENGKSHFLEKFFYPESVAVVGVSRDPLRFNHNLLANLVRLGFQGKIYPVHPRPGEILGLKTYPNLQSIEDPVDLAIVGVPYNLTLSVLKDCVVKGIRRVVVVAGGFSETGEEGRKVQREMARLLRENGIRAIGPNALSPINPSTHLAISFHPIEKIKPGGLSLIFQSGLYEPRLDWLLSDFNLYLNKLIDLGNKMDIHEVDALTYLVQDPQTRVIGIHMESIEGNGREFMRLIREFAPHKHFVVLKSGRTQAGARAAASHTGVIVQGNDLVFDAALRQAGALRAQSIEDFFDLSKGLERFGSHLMKGNRISLATLPGGEGVILTDLCQQEGLSLARLEDRTIERLKPVFPPWDIGGNPYDLGVSIQFNEGNVIKVYNLLLQALPEDPNVDGLAIQIPPRAITPLLKDFFQIFPRASAVSKKPIVLWVAGMLAGQSEILQGLEDQYVPVFSCPEKAIRALSALHRSSLCKSAA